MLIGYAALRIRKINIIANNQKKQTAIRKKKDEGRHEGGKEKRPRDELA